MQSNNSKTELSVLVCGDGGAVGEYGVGNYNNTLGFIRWSGKHCAKILAARSTS